MEIQHQTSPVSQPIEESRLYRFIHVLLILLAVLVYYGFVLSLSSNVPYSDDFNDILWTLISYVESDNTFDKLSTLLRQHNEHKTLIPRLIYLSHYLLFHHVNFATLIVVGNLAILGLYVGFLKQLGNNRFIQPIAVMLAFTLFQAQTIQSMFWAMAAVSNYYVLFFAMLSLAILTHKKTYQHLVLAGAVGLLATFTQANGMLVFGAGAVYLFQNLLLERKKTQIGNNKVSRDSNKESQQRLVFWLLLSALAAFAYLYNFHHTKATSSILTRISSDPLMLVSYYLKVMGSGFAQSNPTAALFSGVFLLFSFGLMLFKRFHIRHAGLFYFLIFILMSIFIITLSRTIWGDHQALAANRYRILSVNIWAISLLFYVDTYLQQQSQRNRLICFGILIVVIVGFVHSYYLNYPKVKRLQHTIVSDLKHWMIEEGAISSLLPFWAAFYSTDMMTRAIKHDIYRPDHLLFENVSMKEVSAERCLDWLPSPLELGIAPISKSTSYAQSIGISLADTFLAENTFNSAFLLLCSGSHQYRMTLNAGALASLDSELTINFSTLPIASGSYKLGLALSSESGNQTYGGAEKLSIDNSHYLMKMDKRQISEGKR
ncbi:MAG: hypothetical protein KUG82_22965 [Pseudomonadales bacterium]|nr:hypothetical protein [Pseudomonadales bacterium]